MNNGPTYGGPISPLEEDKEVSQINSESHTSQGNAAASQEPVVKEQQELVKEVSKDRAGWRKRRRPRHVEPENSEERHKALNTRTTEESLNDDQKPADSSHVAQQDASPGHKGVVTSWARGGARSHTTRNSLGASNNTGRHSNRCVRATVLLDFLTSSARKENEDEVLFNTFPPLC
jgi:hypothetical protein